MSKAAPIGGKVLTRPFLILACFSILALILMGRRFYLGLGSVSNLSDGYPWGLWIVYDVVTGTALACGGYAMALLIYIFNKQAYHPLIKPALLTSVFGYTLASVSIVVDTGRYWHLQNIFLPKYANTNSVMFEVATCISLYIMVLWIEFSPTLLESVNKVHLARRVQKVMFFFIGLGVLLPTMHQASLGSLLIVAGHKVSPLWQTMFLPLLFLISAIILGYGMVIFESIYASIHLKRPLETHILTRLSGVIPWLLAIFIVVRLGDLVIRGLGSSIFTLGTQSVLFIVEMVLFSAPAIILIKKENRKDARLLFFSAVSAVLAGVLYRFNAFLIAFNPGEGWHYFPAASEILITLGIISFELMAYLFLVKKVPILASAKSTT